jgi:GNAT superfamily N-acetyltransferase
MNEDSPLADITFTENGQVDVNQLNALYKMIGWDNQRRRTAADTTEMLNVSRYYVAAHTGQGRLIGFARVCGDPYVVLVLDVITHPQYRRCGIATKSMNAVLEHLNSSQYVSVMLTDESGIEGFYRRFGFQVFRDVALVWERSA